MTLEMGMLVWAKVMAEAVKPRFRETVVANSPFTLHVSFLLSTASSPVQFSTAAVSGFLFIFTPSPIASSSSSCRRFQNSTVDAKFIVTTAPPSRISP
ncbi:hypothetical protein BVRB_2g030120 [Beta vulgaris subsp. vulgaris]|nr:hypothetical protein BVRB_2g030120 [Beta vulgaris subsp. vulgaris]